MNKKLLALLIIAVLPLMAFDCITDFSSVTVSLNLAPITATVMIGVDQARMGAVTGLLSTLQQAGNAIGVAVIGVIFLRRSTWSGPP